MLSAAERRAKMGAVIRAASGNFLELYDYLVYLIYATYVANAFFPTNSEFTSLMLALMTYGIASLARPFGALVLGSYSDRKGRRKGLILSLSLMAVGTASIAFTPGYMTIGLFAALFVTIGRLIQGFSLGVESGGVNIYLVEIATPGNRGFYGAWQGASQALGVVAAAAVGVVLTVLISGDQMKDWGWRVPFLIGCAIIPIIFWLRGSLQETEVFKKSRHAQSTGEVMRILLEHWPIVAVGVLLQVFNTTSFYFVGTYTAIFGSQVLHLAPAENLMVAFLVGISSFALLPIFGALSDRIGRWPQAISAPLVMILTAYPMMSWLVAAPSFTRLLLFGLWLSFLYAIYAGTLVPLITEIMPAKVRTSGFAIVISIANGIFGTFTPAISTLLIQMTDNRAAPALWLSAAAAVSFVAAVSARRFAPKPVLQPSA
jgi:MHS family citrate/tricarballylate:H+ symporter-like MFS transporter